MSSKTDSPLVEITKKDQRLRARQLAEGYIQIELSNRWTRVQDFNVTCYLVGDILIDTGFSKIAGPMEQFLASRPVSAIVCTHNHEDHAGNCGPLGTTHGCPVFLAQSKEQWSEGVGNLPLYRRIWFGTPAPYTAEEMPPDIRGQQHALISLPIPGHSKTHSAFFSASSGTLFCGDLFISGGVTAVMRHENPYETIDSLRSAARLSPRQLLNGHGLILNNPENALLEKAEKIEAATGAVLRLHQRGLSENAIVKRVFRNGKIKDKIVRMGTGGEFCRLNFIRACLQYRPHR